MLNVNAIITLNKGKLNEKNSHKKEYFLESLESKMKLKVIFVFCFCFF